MIKPLLVLKDEGYVKTFLIYSLGHILMFIIITREACQECGFPDSTARELMLLGLTSSMAIHIFNQQPKKFNTNGPQIPLREVMHILM